MERYEEIKELKQGLSIRGDSLYCPLAFALDSYGNCLVDCHHCYFRRLNHVWGTDLKPLDTNLFEKTLINGLANKNPKTPLAHALASKKTIRFGNKADPFQPSEKKYRRSWCVLNILKELNWTFVIQTRFTEALMEHFDLLVRMRKLVTIMPVISPGLDKDWEILERERTTPPRKRIYHLQQFMKAGVNVGVNGEPFIPGFHSTDDFRETLTLLSAAGIPSYNTYNLHYNDWVAKRFMEIGLDFEQIWIMNQDHNWKPILQELIKLSKHYGIILGCPDFVNAGPDYREEANTCCGINVPNPCTYNAITWKRLIQEGHRDSEAMHRILKATWDGVGDYQEGIDLYTGKKKNMFSLQDAGVIDESKEGLF